MLVIGNGESRKDIPIYKLKDEKIGCNAILRDTRVDHLVCVDKRMLNEALDKNYNYKTKIYTSKYLFIRHRLEENVYMLPNIPYEGNQKPDQSRNWGSGPFAVLIAAKSKHQHIKLLGFDLYSKDGNVNNLYKGTENYAQATNRAVDPRYWIYQIGKIFELFPNKNFTIYNDNWNMPEVWKKPNVTLDSISNI